MRDAVARVIAAGACLFAADALPGATADHLAPLELLTLLTPEGRSRVDRGVAVVEVLPARDADLAVFGATQVRVDSDRFVSWMRHVEQLQTGRDGPVSRRFSDPPKLEDLDALSLDGGDLDDLRRCRPGDCGLKLSAPEIARLRQVIVEAESAWRPAVQAAFRRLVHERALRYLANGDAGALPYQDHKHPVALDLEFATLVGRMGLEKLLRPDVADYLQHYPRDADPEVESFLYWSKGVLGSGKRIISITHVNIFKNRGRGTGIAALVASKQVFAHHYLTGSLSLTAITDGSLLAPRYLVYLRRSRADVLDGPFGGLVRRVAEGRVRSEAAGVLDSLRRRLERGEPSEVHQGSR